MTFVEPFLGCSSSTGFPKRTKLIRQMVGLLVTWEKEGGEMEMLKLDVSTYMYVFHMKFKAGQKTEL